ncbi:MAG: helix-turn-helix transcriptional regulator [Hyphomicrobiaceae bacterium]
MTFTLRHRPFVPADAVFFARWLIDESGSSDETARAFEPALRSLFERERMKGVIIERLEDDEGGRWQPLAGGISGFVVPDAITAHLCAPTPFLMAQLLQRSAADAAAVFLDHDAIARGNSSGGLDLLLHWIQLGWDLMDPLWRAVGTMAHEAYVRDHRGYRVNRIMHEDWEREVDVYLMTGYRIFATFDLSHIPSPPGAKAGVSLRHLYYSQPDESLRVAPGTTVSHVLQYAPPRCRFAPAEQRLLRLAVAGQTDQQIMTALDLSQNTIKGTWRSIYDRIQTHAPFVLADTGDEREATGRGPEKRRRVIAFVIAHPQELRPYHWPR